MRIIVTVLALACGSSLAAQSATGNDRHASMDRSRAAVVSTGAQGKPANGMVEKTQRGMHRMGDKTRTTGDRISAKISKTNVRHGEMAKDPRSLGATGPTSSSDRRDRSRQARMDDAYDTWKSQQK